MELNLMNDICYKRASIQLLRSCPTGGCQPWVAPTATNIEAFQASAFGRYITDTSHHCVTVSQPHWAWKWVTIGCKDIYEWQWPQLQFLGTATAYASSEGVVLVAANPGDGMSFEMEVTSNAESQVHLEINSLELAKNASIQVLGEKDGNWEVLGEAPIKDAEGVVLSITPKTNKIKVVLWGPIKVWIGRICVMGLQWVEEDQLVTICDGDGDKYRFGYNGQEKVNEWSGVGNYNEFKERGQDTRIGRFLSVDPIASKYPWNSTYAFAENDVIRAMDLEGRERLDAIYYKDILLKITVTSAEKVENTKYGFQLTTKVINGRSVTSSVSDEFSNTFLNDIKAFKTPEQNGFSFMNSVSFGLQISGNPLGFKLKDGESSILSFSRPNFTASIPSKIQTDLKGKDWPYKYPYIIKNKDGNPRRIASFDVETGFYYDAPRYRKTGEEHALFFNKEGDILDENGNKKYSKPNYDLNTSFKDDPSYEAPMQDSEAPPIKNNFKE